MSLLNEIEEIITRKLLTEVSNETIIRNFITNEFPHDKEEANKYGVKTDTWSPIYGTANLKITRVPIDLDQEVTGWSLNNNATPIIFMDNDGGVYFNTQKYSTATTKIQNTIKGFLETESEIKDKVREVDGNTIIKLIKGEKVGSDTMKKLGDEVPEPEESDEENEETPNEEITPEENTEESDEQTEEETDNKKE